MNNENAAIHVAVNRPSATNGHRERELREIPNPSAQGENRVFHTPPIDIHEGPEGLVLEADLPGVTDSGVNVQLEDNVLSLHAKVDAPVTGDARPLHQEYLVSDYYRSFILSDEVERSQITAELRNGVLRLTLPKAERSKTRRIEVKS
ncbi:MAG: Hsp20/alpha crystallin family protein [Isosphaeraceae bacterium]